MNATSGVAPVSLSVAVMPTATTSATSTTVPTKTVKPVKPVKTTVPVKPKNKNVTISVGTTVPVIVAGSSGVVVLPVVQPGVISMCANKSTSVLRDTANNSCASGEVKVEWLDTGASPKICVNNNREMTLAQDGKCVAKNTSVVVASNKQVLACVDDKTGVLRYQPSGVCATKTDPVNWVVKGQGVSKNVDDAVKKGVNETISLIPTKGAAGTGAGSTKTVTTSPATNTSSATTTTSTTAPTSTTTTTSSTTTTTSSSTTTTTTVALRAVGSFAGYLGGTCPDGSGLPWYWGIGGVARAGGCSAAASVAPATTAPATTTTAVSATTVAPVVVPGTPGTPTGVAGNLQVTVSVTAGSGGTPTSYTITQSTSSTGTYSTGCTVTVPASSCVVTGLTNSTAYFFKTTATNSAGTSSLSTASSSVTPVVTVSGAPTIGTATIASPTSVTVACTAPSSNGGATITTYTATAVGTAITGTLTSATCSTAITVSGLTTGTAYTFTVTATNSVGTSVASGASNSVTPVVTVPGAPTIGTATVASATTVTVACTAPSSNGGATITTYTFTSSPGGITATLTSATCTTTTVTGLTTGTAYTFTVTATNSAGTSLASAASNSATTAVTCAAGGACIVGDTGPGGGKVFYVSAANFTSTGSDCNTACKYLEAATSDQSSGIAWATTAAFCYNSGSTTETNNCQLNSIYSGDSTAQAASRTAATAIGKGMANTNQIYARVSNGGGVGGAATNTYAAGIAYAYVNSGKTDWHLPSKNELNQMCKWQRGVAWVSDATVCTGGTLNSGTGASSFSSGLYWSSSGSDANLAWYQLFNNGGQGFNVKSGTGYVRPVRAFG